MKKLIIFAFATLLGSECFSQVKAVFPEYNSPSKEELRDLAFSPTAKGYAFRTSLIENINIGLKDTTFKVAATRIDEIFAHLFLEEVYLEEGGYKNSGYDVITHKMVQSIGHKWTGFAWVFRIGTFVIIVMKGDCGNILTVPVTKIQKNQGFKQDTIRNTVYINDTVRNTTVNNNDVVPNQNNYEQQQNYSSRVVILRSSGPFFPATNNTGRGCKGFRRIVVLRSSGSFYPATNNTGRYYTGTDRR